MVDFRYHIVSLVSVFLALAVGVILGAGPLQDSIGTALSSQVDSLRDSRDAARTELDAAQAELDTANAQLDAAGSALTSGKLKDKTIALVTVPGVSSDTVAAVKDKLEASGAAVSGVVTLTDAYFATDSATYREALAGTLAQYAGADSTAGADSILGSAVSTVVRKGASDSNASLIVDSMKNADNVLIKTSGDLNAAQGVVIVLPETLTSAQSTSATPSKADETTMTNVLKALVTSLSAGGATVAAGPGSDDASAIAVARSASAGSTVDTVDGTAGPYNVVLAIVSELAKSHVSLGVGNGATALGTGK